MEDRTLKVVGLFCGWVSFLLKANLISKANCDLIYGVINRDLMLSGNSKELYLFPIDKDTLINRVEYVEKLINEELINSL